MAFRVNNAELNCEIFNKIIIISKGLYIIHPSHLTQQRHNRHFELFSKMKVFFSMFKNRKNSETALTVLTGQKWKIVRKWQNVKKGEEEIQQNQMLSCTRSLAFPLEESSPYYFNKNKRHYWGLYVIYPDADLHLSFRCDAIASHSFVSLVL